MEHLSKGVQIIGLLVVLLVTITIGYACSNGSSAVNAQSTVAVPTVSAMYINGVAQSIPNSTITVINFDTKNFDTLNTVTTGASWKFTAPSAGYYSVQVGLMINSGCNWTAATTRQMRIIKNSAVVLAGLDYVTDVATHSTPVTMHGDATVQLAAGDYIYIDLQQDTGGGCSISSGANDFVSITKVGS